LGYGVHHGEQCVGGDAELAALALDWQVKLLEVSKKRLIHLRRVYDPGSRGQSLGFRV